MSDDNNDIGAWLEELGLPEYIEVFVEQRIGIDVLKDLEDTDLKDLGVPVGDRKRLRRAIKDLDDSSDESAPIQTGSTRAERRHVTIMFVDMGESTELSTRLDPEDYAQTIKRFQRQTTNLIEEWQGFIARFFGDGILAYFGWPKASEDDAERAARAALEITKQVATLQADDGTTLSCRIGIATGLVVVEDIVGNRMSFQDSIYGVTPNLAARLQSCAEPGEIIISSETRQLLRNWFTTSFQGKTELKGIEGKVDIWRLDSMKPGSTRFEALSDQTRLSPLVGREEELSKLQDLWGTAVESKGVAVLVKGDAGLGKSRLVHELTQQSIPETSNVIYLQCSPFHQNTAAYPVVEHLAARAGIADVAPGQSVFKNIADELSAGNVTDRDSIRLISDFLGVGDKRETDDPETSPSVHGSRTLGILASYLAGLSDPAPLMLVIEDAHWIDPTTVVIIERLFELMADHAILVIVTARPEFDDLWFHANCQLIEVLPLQARDADQLTDAIAGSHGLSADISGRIFDATNGIPLFVEEVTRMLIESGDISVQDEKLVLNTVIEDISIPTNLRDSLAAKIDALPDAKPLACLCATVGRKFSYNFVRAVSKQTDHETDAQLKQLIEASILTLEASEGIQRFAFTHALMHETAYSMLLHSDRRELHLRIARALETQTSTSLDSSPQILAHHFERAEHLEDAANCLLLAGERALEMSATTEALAQLTRGISLLEPLACTPPLDQIRLRLHASIGTAHMMGKGWGAPEVEHAYSSAMNLSAGADISERLWISWGAWVYRQVSGRIAGSVSLADEILLTAQQSEDSDALLVAHMIQLQKNFYTGNFELALSHGDQLVQLYDREKHLDLKNSYSTDLLLVWHVHAAQARWIMGDSAGAQHEYNTASKIANSLDHAHSLAWFLSWGANYLLLDKQFALILETVPKALEIAEKHHFNYTLSLGKIILAEARGQFAGMKADFSAAEEALAEFQQTGAGIAVPYFLTRQASARMAVGDYVAAQEKIDSALAQSARWGELWGESMSLRVRGDILAGQANPDLAAAESSYRAAINLAANQGAAKWWFEASIALGRLLTRQNRDYEARELYAILKGDSLPVGLVVTDIDSLFVH